MIRVLEQIDNGTFPSLEFVELNACNGGCVGGMMTVENPYIARARLQTLKRYLPVSQNWRFEDQEGATAELPPELKADPVEYAPVSKLSENMGEAMRKMAMIQTLHDELPDLDCGSCGSPTCYLFAEDVVKGEARPEECIVRMREELLKAAKEGKV